MLSLVSGDNDDCPASRFADMTPDMKSCNVVCVLWAASIEPIDRKAKAIKRLSSKKLFCTYIKSIYLKLTINMSDIITSWWSN